MHDYLTRNSQGLECGVVRVWRVPSSYVVYKHPHGDFVGIFFHLLVSFVNYMENFCLPTVGAFMSISLMFQPLEPLYRIVK